MPDLLQTLQGNDLGFLQIVAETWKVDLDAPDAFAAANRLALVLTSSGLVQDIVDALPTQVQTALQAVVDANGHMPWALFTRRFGEVRVMGAAKRDRERPDLKPISPAEWLWYRALIGRAFFSEESSDPQEYVYIPNEFQEILKPQRHSASHSPGRVASPGESAFIFPTGTKILDQACTLLASLRSGTVVSVDEESGIPWAVLKLLLHTAGIIDKKGLPIPEATRKFLEAPCGEALAILGQAWQKSTTFNELHLVPGLICEGEWVNDPLKSRIAILDVLSQIPQTTWWNLTSFLNYIKETQPDFQRPAGDYDSWFIRQAESETYLRGVSAWDQVDGAYIRYLITEPLYWLGWCDLAAPGPDKPVEAFRFTAWAVDLWKEKIPNIASEETGKVRVSPNGLLVVPGNTPRAVRYILARCSQWLTSKENGYRYRLTPSSLENAAKQGLKISHITSILRKFSSGPIPPTLIEALERWEKVGVQSQIESVVILKVSQPQILTALQQSRAGRYINEVLSPTVATLKSGKAGLVSDVLVELGYLAETSIEYN
ncbi:MAG TPA: helicase-associated domain-containing protein [Longilinea sp.]|nr:helicase-associated domain-containing protein [Longilinea sp.]